MPFDPSVGCDDAFVQAEEQMATIAAHKDVIIQVALAILGSGPLMSRIVDKSGPEVDIEGNCLKTANQVRADRIVDQAMQIVGNIVRQTSC